jgi:hypothetical protein
MAAVAKSGTPSLSSPVPAENQKVSGLKAGEAIAAGDFVYVKSDGKVWLANGTAATAPARVRGIATIAAPVGEAVTFMWDVNFRYGAGLTPGADYYLSAATPGGLSDVATTGGVNPIAYAVDDTRIRVLAPR